MRWVLIFAKHFFPITRFIMRSEVLRLTPVSRSIPRRGDDGFPLCAALAASTASCLNLRPDPFFRWITFNALPSDFFKRLQTLFTPSRATCHPSA